MIAVPRVFVFLFLLAVASMATPRMATAIVADTLDTAKYWIFFLDREDGSYEVPAGPEPGYLTERAIERRVIRGKAQSTAHDAPLSPTYLNVLRSLDVIILMESRWFNAVTTNLTESQVHQVAELPFVREVRPVAIAREQSFAGDIVSPVFSGGVNSLYGPSELQLSLMNATRTLQQGYNGKGVRIGFLDTLFDFDHPALSHIHNEARLIAVEDFTGKEQTNMHGLSVVSTAVGYAEGVLVGPAHGAEVIAATTEFAPTETRKEEDDFVRALEWMERKGVDVVNVSLGYTTFDPGEGSYTYADMDGRTAVTTMAVNRAASLGVALVVSAGNSGACGEPSPSCWYYVSSPADSDSVISVGAVRPDSSRAHFSSFGPTADGRIKPDVAALGVSVIAAVRSGFSFVSGTSFSSPLVAGVVAQILQANPALKPLEIRDILRATAHRSDQPDNSTGWGVINAEAAILYAVEGTVEEETPASFGSILQYPNPFSRETNFKFHSPTSTEPIQIVIYDLHGRRVATAFDGYPSPGANFVTFDAQLLPAGFYFYRLDGAGLAASGKMVLAR